MSVHRSSDDNSPVANINAAAARSDDEKYRGNSKLQENVALIRGEGHRHQPPRSRFISPRRALTVPVVYLEEHRQAKETQRLVGNQNRKCLFIASDIGLEELHAPAAARSERELVCLGKIKATLVDEP